MLCNPELKATALYVSVECRAIPELILGEIVSTFACACVLSVCCLCVEVLLSIRKLLGTWWENKTKNRLTRNDDFRNLPRI